LATLACTLDVKLFLRAGSKPFCCSARGGREFFNASLAAILIEIKARRLFLSQPRRVSLVPLIYSEWRGMGKAH